MQRAGRDVSDRDLPALLRSAAAEVITEKGLGAFSIREVARRAGVSHGAPGYHFGDSTGLLTALAAEGFETLHSEMTAAAAGVGDPVQRLTEIGRAYVRVAAKYPAHCEVIFREDLVNADDAALEAAGRNAFTLLRDTIQAIADTHNADLNVHAAAELCWSAMQGLVQLLPKFARVDAMMSQPVASADDKVATFTALMVQGLVGHAP
jgi:AcrR family transcriptional regulator